MLHYAVQLRDSLVVLQSYGTQRQRIIQEVVNKLISVFQWYVVLLGMFVNETFHIRCFARNVC